MSADNWATCPSCSQQKSLALRKLKAQYGKIPVEDYMQKLEEVESIEPTDNDKPTLREDYEIGIFDEKFEISYYAQCEKCGFKKKFKHEEWVVEIYGKEVK